MNKDSNTFQSSPVINYNYSRWFQEWEYNNKVLTDSERKEFAFYMDEMIAAYSEGLPLFSEELERIQDCHDELHELIRTIGRIGLFELITTIDSMVACKYFIIADKDYDRRYMRGKLKIILNEGFKKLYGFNKDNYKKSEWARLSSIIERFPPIIRNQYQEMSTLLETHSKKPNWWKNERDLEVHLDAENLYVSRKEDLNDSIVVMEFMRLFDTLSAVGSFLTNAHAYLCNTLIDTYCQRN